MKIRQFKKEMGLWIFRIGFIWFLLVTGAANRAALAQTENGITSPSPGDVVSGVVIVQGSAGGSSFLRYEMAFNGGAEWIVFAEGDQPVLNGTLAIWDTTVGAASNPVFPDGVYQLRLRVVRQDFNYSEYFVSNITIANQGAGPTATPVVEPAGSPTVISPVATNTPVEGGGLSLPTAIPSLTPFPTPSPAATARILDPVESGQPGGTVAENGDNQGLLAQLQAVDTGRFGRAFRQGVIITVYLFLALGFYLMLRGLWRWVWRRVR